MKSLLWLKSKGSILEDIEVELPLSKSISNRVLILNAISQGKIYSKEYSQASDSKILQKCLEDKNSNEYDVQDAGTSFRFITALAAIGDHEVIVTGTERMKKRPISGLIDIIRDLGALVTYIESDGYPPIKIKPLSERLKTKKKLTINDTSSSQFISALMLIAPKIKGGINLKFTENIPSYSYIQMTADILKLAGIEVQLGSNSVIIPEQKIEEKKVLIDIESDWTGASYFFSLMAVGNWSTIYLSKLNLISIQKDSNICKYFIPLGIEAEQTEKGVILLKREANNTKNEVFDFRNNPDLAMTVIVAYALNKVDIKICGIENLRIKESDRIEALQKELSKINVQLLEKNEFWYLKTSGLTIPEFIYIETYKDHRIAMAFSILALKTKVTFDNPEVVHKSFPDFWDQLKKLGLSTNII